MLQKKIIIFNNSEEMWYDKCTYYSLLKFQNYSILLSVTVTELSFHK